MSAGGDALGQALALFRAGRLAECESELRALVAREPQRAEAFEMLGAAIGAQGRHDDALGAFDRARELRPSAPSIRRNRAQALAALGRLDEARAELEKALHLQPDHAPSWNLLGNLLATMSDVAAAERAYRRALQIDSRTPQTHYNLGHLLQVAGRDEEAIACYRAALALRGDFVAAHNNLAAALRARGENERALAHYAEAVRLQPDTPELLANYAAALREAGRVDEAIALLRRAAAQRPESAQIANNLGIAFYARHHHEEAIAEYRRALRLKADFHEARVNLGHALAEQGETDAAIACYREVIASAPSNPDAYSHLGLAMQERGDEAAAMANYREALARRPDHPDALSNLGYLLQEEGRLEEAMAYYRRALEANPRSARAGYNLGLAHLSRFEFQPGWELHELRFATTPPVSIPRAFKVPAWTSADAGKAERIAVWAEQGVGDQLLYSTLLPELETRGESFVLETDARLVPAFRRSHPSWNVVARDDSSAAFASCTRHVAIGSLGRLLRPTVAGFESQPAALLAADPERVRACRERIAAPGVRSVAISWRSFQPKGRAHVQRRKSAELEAFLALSRREDVRLVDVQYGDTRAEREAFAQQGGRLARFDGLDLFDDLDGVLAAIAACDLVVTTSNVTAHFGGVLGKPTWLLYPRAIPPFHYWAPRADGSCLWYPALRIVTAADLASWDELLVRVDALLGGID